MTGRELIIYILENNLEDTDVFDEGIFIGFTRADKYAAKHNIGVATVKAWKELGWIEGFMIGDVLYIKDKG